MMCLDDAGEPIQFALCGWLEHVWASADGYIAISDWKSSWEFISSLRQAAEKPEIDSPKWADILTLVPVDDEDNMDRL